MNGAGNKIGVTMRNKCSQTPSAVLRTLYVLDILNSSYLFIPLIPKLNRADTGQMPMSDHSKPTLLGLYIFINNGLI